ncbi:DnaB-like helicase C-terminal domain-containing protein, partial [bacterium]|nr:DnaB-like helicase C-terminal domain-containing protein [bacterium]
CGVDWWDGIQPFGGIEKGSLVVLAAPPRCYKTSLMLFLAWKFAKTGRRVHYLAGEMTRPALVRRVVSMAGEVSPNVVMEPRSLVERKAVATGIEMARSLGDRLVFGQAPITITQIKTSAAESDLVVVDYLQLIKPEFGGTGRVEELEALMATLLGVIQRGGTILAAAALNRGGMAQASLSSLRGSSAIEYGAHAVFVGTEKLARLEEGPFGESGPVVYRCVKQREGEARDLRFGIEPRLGPLPIDPSQECGS